MLFQSLSLRRWLAMALVCAGLTLACGMAVMGDESLIANGELTSGSGAIPDHWRPVSLRNLSYAKEAATFGWSHQPGSGEMSLTDITPNFVRWGQTISLAPGWYSLHGEMRTEPSALRYGSAVVGSALIGIHLENSTFGAEWSAGDSQDWYKGGLYFKVGARERTVEIVCQLAGKGRASFRHIGLSRISAPPPPNARQIDLDAIPQSPSREPELLRVKPFQAPTGRPWTIFALMLALAAAALSGWLLLGLEDRPQP